MLRISLLSLSLLLAVGCSGSGSSAGSSASSAGGVRLLLDTATGSPALVQFQVVGAMFETSAGTMTGNVLGAPQMLTVADPMGMIEGLSFVDVPPGSYTALHLALAPGSGVARYPDGVTVDVDGTVALEIRLADRIEHDGARNLWVVCGHEGNAPPASPVTSFAWSPVITARGSGSAVTLSGLDVALLESEGLTARMPRLGDAPVFLTFGDGCSFLGENHSSYPGRAEFLADSQLGDVLWAEGDLSHRGEFRVRRVRREGRRSGRAPRLIGRVTALEPATTSFVMDVFAEARRGGPVTLPLPAQARVLAAGAEIERSSTGVYLTFADIEIGQLAKVEWLSRTVLANGWQELVADEIEIAPADGVAMEPEWQGMVSAVDLTLRTITVVPRHDDPIVVQNQSVLSLTAYVPAGVPVLRHESGSPRVIVPLQEVVPGRDRIWLRGQVTGPADIEASRVRVRDDS